ncbi:MAG: hypothetical protein ACM359_18360 [Bacillota bacterium]
MYKVTAEGDSHLTIVLQGGEDDEVNITFSADRRQMSCQLGSASEPGIVHRMQYVDEPRKLGPAEE